MFVWSLKRRCPAVGVRLAYDDAWEAKDQSQSVVKFGKSVGRVERSNGPRGISQKMAGDRFA